MYKFIILLLFQIIHAHAIPSPEIHYDAENHTIAFEWKGIPIQLNSSLEGDYIREVQMKAGFYEAYELEYLSQYIHSGDLVLDVGANVGNHSIYFSKVCSADVIAFEPCKRALKILERNVALNSVDIKIYPIALGEIEGKGNSLEIWSDNLGGSPFKVTADGAISIMPLDSFTFPKKVAVVKADIEGGEMAMLKGARNLIEKDHPIIQLEALDVEALSQQKDFLEHLGYKLVHIIDRNYFYQY